MRSAPHKRHCAKARPRPSTPPGKSPDSLRSPGASTAAPDTSPIRGEPARHQGAGRSRATSRAYLNLSRRRESETVMRIPTLVTVPSTGKQDIARGRVRTPGCRGAPSRPGPTAPGLSTARTSCRRGGRAPAGRRAAGPATGNRLFSKRGQGPRPASAAVCRIPCRILCFADV